MSIENKGNVYVNRANLSHEGANLIGSTGYVGIDGLRSVLEDVYHENDIDKPTYNYSLAFLEVSRKTARDVLQEGLVASANHNICHIGIDDVPLPSELKTKLDEEKLVADYVRNLRRIYDISQLSHNLNFDEYHIQDPHKIIFVAERMAENLIGQKTIGGSVQRRVQTETGDIHTIETLERWMIGYVKQTVNRSFSQQLQIFPALSNVFCADDVVEQAILDLIPLDKFTPLKRNYHL